MLPALVLAAGRSQRMGRVKALLPFQGEPLVVVLLMRLQELEISPRVVVLGHHAEVLEEALDRNPGLAPTRVRNPNPDQGQLSSLLVGLEALPPSAPGFFLMPVDHGLVSTSTLESLCQRVQEDPSRIVVPSYQMRRGHPSWFPRDSFVGLRENPKGGAREVLRRYPRIHHEVVEDPQVRLDLDTPEDLQRARDQGHT